MTTTKDDLAFVKDEDQWPVWPVLPLVSKNGGEVGLIIAGSGPVVYKVNVFDLKNGLEGVPKQTYLDFEGLLDDWRVD